MKTFFAASAIAAALLLALSPANASDGKGSHAEHAGSHSGQSEMKEVPGNKPATVTGVINSVDTAAGKINITHEPVPELGWPKMTMDLPVTRKVDLSTVKPGSVVDFTLKQGRDKQFRVIAIEPKQ